MTTNLIEAAKLAKGGSVTTEEMCEFLLKAINDVPNQIQFFVDQIVEMQKEWPMPKESWEQFQKDLEYTNEKHGLNLRIKSELLE